MVIECLSRMTACPFFNILFCFGTQGNLTTNFFSGPTFRANSLSVGNLPSVAPR